MGSDSLTEELEVVNGTSAETPLTFTSALHTYFRVSDISQSHVEGLSGLKYLDNMQNRQEGTDVSQVISVNGEIDRIYVKAPDHLKVTPAVPCTHALLSLCCNALPMHCCSTHMDETLLSGCVSMCMPRTASCRQTVPEPSQTVAVQACWQLDDAAIAAPPDLQ